MDSFNPAYSDICHNKLLHYLILRIFWIKFTGFTGSTFKILAGNPTYTSDELLQKPLGLFSDLCQL